MLANREALTLAAPAILGGVLYYVCLRRIPSRMTPLLMAAFVAAFFLILAVTSSSLQVFMNGVPFPHPCPSVTHVFMLVEEPRFLHV